MPLLAVNHHYYRPVAPQGGIYPISPAQLRSEVMTLRRRYRLPRFEAAPLIVEEIDDWSSDNVAILTFDDGLKEQMAALRDLERLDTAAIFFVPTMPAVHGKLLDVHKLHLIRSLREDASLFYNLETYFPNQIRDLDEAAAEKQYRYDTPTARKIKFLLNFVLDAESRNDWINHVFEESVGSEVAVARDLYMDADDIRTLAKLGLLGTHGHNHIPLAQVDSNHAKADVLESLNILEHVGGERIRGISYPYGGPSAVSNCVAELCGELGLRYGFTMQRGLNSTTDQFNPMLLKRIDCKDVGSFV